MLHGAQEEVDSIYVGRGGRKLIALSGDIASLKASHTSFNIFTIFRFGDWLQKRQK